ncbi:10960_t:CDS:2, partial [Racocetra persica]
MTQKNNIPPYGEEQIINQEQLSIQEILAQFQQPIPNNFIPIETEHICSTKSKWDKPLSERYDPTVLTRPETYKGITIENE